MATILIFILNITSIILIIMTPSWDLTPTPRNPTYGHTYATLSLWSTMNFHGYTCMWTIFLSCNVSIDTTSTILMYLLENGTHVRLRQFALPKSEWHMPKIWSECTSVPSLWTRMIFLRSGFASEHILMVILLSSVPIAPLYRWTQCHLTWMACAQFRVMAFCAQRIWDWPLKLLKEFFFHERCLPPDSAP